MCIVTSDNPPTEDPEAIIKQILTGMPENSYIAIENRPKPSGMHWTLRKKMI